MAIFALPSESLYYNDDFTDDDVGSLNSYKLACLSGPLSLLVILV